jgi:DNA-binding GntR family transcriptional regulator
MSIIIKSTLKDEVGKWIREAIINNEIKPGERIVETKLAKHLGVSQAPVREAVKELELMGLIEIKPFLGSFVKKLSKKDIKDAYNLRAHLEMFAACEATKNITDEDLIVLEELLEKMREAGKNHMFQEFIELDIDFHRTIIKVANNSLLEKVWTMINFAQWTLVTTKVSKRSLFELADRHYSIYESLKKRNSKEAAKALKTHIDELGEEILLKFDENQ